MESCMGNEKGEGGGKAKGGVEDKAVWHLTGGAERGRADGGGSFELALSGRKQRRRPDARTAVVRMTRGQRGFR
jgi:hypothetical protein